ncbi:hypothetical protein [Streptomyces sp. NPDC051704]|uniref:hypothetical protein n=1 Tax=Streptomyces sp. NPDC051704 TaxID=3365671 RepID=UPI0037A93B12
MTPVPPLPAHAEWHDTGTSVFSRAVRADGRWWVLRLNHFPEHPAGTPCAGDWCTCEILTDEYAARLATPPADPASP